MTLLASVLFLSPSLALADWHRAGPAEPPPTVQVEVTRERPGYVWARGHHVYHHHRYHWTRGRYYRERPGWTWRDGAWERHEDHYDWHPGGWRR